MSDWNVGDLAVCVDDSPCRCLNCLTKATSNRRLSVVRDRIYAVEALGINPRGALCLILVGVPKRDGHLRGTTATRFRKVVKDKHEACETEFVTLLKRSRVPLRAGIVRDLIFTMGRDAR